MAGGDRTQGVCAYVRMFLCVRERARVQAFVKSRAGDEVEAIAGGGAAAVGVCVYTSFLLYVSYFTSFLLYEDFKCRVSTYLPLPEGR